VRRQKQKKINTTLAAMIGNALEHYDMSLYGFMVPILISIFLPEVDPLNALIFTFVFSPINIIIRPIGALTIGRIGDKYGRKKALVVSITGMAIATGAIGLLPGYYSIGLWAPILFLFFRIMQGFFIAGESCGGAVFVLENTKENRGYFSGLYCSYAVIGMVFAAIVVTLISYLPKEFWRVPYLIGSLTGILGFYIRTHVKETPKFLQYKNTELLKFRDLLKGYKSLASGIGASGLFSALYLLPVYLMNSLLPIITSFKLPVIMSVNSATTILYMLSLPMFGKLADKISLSKSMILAALSVVVFSYPLISLISYDKLLYIIIMKSCFAILAAWFCAPFYAWMHELFHTKERYTAVSLSYSIGGQLGGSMVPLSLWLWKRTHNLASIYAVLILWALVALVALTYSRSLKKHD